MPCRHCTFYTPEGRCGLAYACALRTGNDVSLQQPASAPKSPQPTVKQLVALNPAHPWHMAQEMRAANTPAIDDQCSTDPPARAKTHRPS